MLDFAKTAQDRQVLELKFSAYDVGYAFMAPPETPPDRVAALRAAMAATADDPAYRADAERERLEVDPVARRGGRSNSSSSPMARRPTSSRGWSRR